MDIELSGFHFSFQSFYYQLKSTRLYYQQNENDMILCLYFLNKSTVKRWLANIEK